MRAIAFYLPQFHVLAENEVIYGKGFTEWFNVRNAKARFPGHRQPRRPHPLLGYYDLLDEKTILLQHQLAYENGISGFCYYYYNFGGNRPLLHKPLHIINNSKTIKNDLCLCWDARGWYDNRNNRREVFLEQTYSPRAATLVFEDLLRYFDNERYIRIDGKPLFAVFAPETHPMLNVYADIWREQAHKHGLPGLWLAGVEAFEGREPYGFGLDGMIEFAPNWIGEAQISPPGAKPRRLDYTQILKFMLSKDVPDYPYLRCAFPEWDNTPRRGENGVVITGTSPELFKTYLECLVEYTQSYAPPSLQYIFLNAWNEWGETCCIEPEAERGFEYLEIVRDVMKGAGVGN